MATYVNNLRLKEIATGDESGTWGTSTNTNLELIGEALGYNTQDCFASDADATTTVADGSTDPARAFYFKVTSSATLTATRTLTIAPNTVSRVMIIENATTGSQSIAISQGSGANVTVPTGEVKMVYLDGAGSGAAVVDAFTNLKVTDAAQTNITSVGTLTSLTVSGDATFDTDTLKVDSTNNRVGVGIASPDWNLQVESGSNTVIAITSGTTSNAQIRFGDSGDDNIGMINYDNSSDSLAFTTNASERMRIDSSGKLLVGDSASHTTDLLQIETPASGGGHGIQIRRNDANTDQVIGHIMFGNNTDTDLVKISAKTDGDSNAGDSGALLFSTQPTGGSNTERMRIDSSGNVGIGESANIDAKLHVTSADSGGTFHGQADEIGCEGSGHSGINILSGTSSEGSLYFGDSDDNNAGRLVYDHSGNSMQFFTNAAERMRIDSSGQVGIGTTSPSQKLEILDTSNAKTRFAYSSSVYGEIGRKSDGNYEFSAYENGANILFGTSTTNGATTERMRIDSSGNVGIGQTTLNSALDIDAEQTYNGIGTPVVRIGSVNNTGVYAMYGAGWGGNTTYSPVTFGMIGTSGSGSVKGDFILATRDVTTDSAPSERFRITSDGKAGIGTSSPSHKLEVSDGAVASKYDASHHVAIRGLSGGQYIQYSSANPLEFVSIDTYPNSGATSRARLTTNGHWLVGTNSTTIDSSNFGAVIFSDGRPKFSKNVSGSSHVMNVYGNAGEFRVFGDGDVQNTNNSYGQISDERLKENIVDATDKLNEINQVRIRNFNFIGDDQKQIGVIAQELETIFPSMVKTTSDTDSDGNDLGTETKSVKYSVFVPILIKALQEADDKIDALEARIEALEA